ncbi:MAG TPA: hypothetical protein VHO90_09785 [Bacteroidales bacterium]|nr:hypothetical protein [Bacteroidales bacterium]
MMAFINNPMLSATENSTSKALRISTYHDNALAAEKDDPSILELYTPYHAAHVALRNAIEAWDQQADQQQGATRLLNQLLRTLSSTKAEDWDLAIQIKFRKSTPEYKILMPYGRSLFQAGTQLERLQAIEVLNEILDDYTTLADTKTDVNAFNTQIQKAYNDQKEQIYKTKGKSDEIEPARKTMCITQFGDVGGLLKKYAATPEKILKYFDMSVLAPNMQNTFTGQLKAGQIYTIAKRTFKENNQVILNNTGNTTLKFYLAAERNKQAGTQGVTMAHGKRAEQVTALGSLADTFLIVVNTDTSFAGSFELEIL